MSDIFSSVWNRIEKGWQDGASGSALGPSVGRGLFANPFLTERDRDLQDLHTLYQHVHAAHARSPFADLAALDPAVLGVLKDACRDSGIANLRWAAALGYWPVRDLLEDEFFSLPRLNEGDWSRITLHDLSELRAELLRRDKHLCRPHETFDLASRALRILLARIFDAAGEGGSHNGRAALTLEARALDALHAPAEQIEFAWGLFFNQDLCDAELFEAVRSQLRRNTYTACRIDPADPRAGSKVIPPTQAKGRELSELASDYLGQTPLADFFDADLPISIPDEVRFEHAHILGGSGHGKSQLLLHLIHSDLMREEGPGLIVMDSQGDLVSTIARLELFRPGGPLAERLVLIDPADVEYPLSLGLFDIPRERLAQYGPAERERLLNGAIEMYEYVFSSLLGAELTQKQGVIFRFLARLMLVVPGATLFTFLDLMEHGDRFGDHMRQLDGTARRFFDEEFFHPSFAATKKQIAKRLWGILANPVFERMFSQTESRLDFFNALQDGKIVLISTAKDLLRQEGAEMLGRFFLAKITQAVMERAALSLVDRRPAFLYVDEAHEYVDAQMAQLLNQARKYRVGLTLAHQNLDQLPLSLRASVMSSTAIKFAGGVSAKDARALSDEMQTDADFLQRMRKRRGTTEFACFVRNRTPRALSVSIPLGAVNDAPTLSDEEYKQLIADNRARWCVPAAARAEASTQTAPSPSKSAQMSLPAPSMLEAVPSAPPAEHAAPDPHPAGQGGRDHKYLQFLVRSAAHERGLRADIEAAVPGGSVDVAIDARGTRIACEISITTTAVHEAANAAKAQAAGFDLVWIIASTSRRRAALAKGLADVLRENAKVRVLTVSEALVELDALSVEAPPEPAANVRGYSVVVRRSTVTPDESRRKREAVAAVLAKSLKGKE